MSININLRWIKKILHESDKVRPNSKNTWEKSKENTAPNKELTERIINEIAKCIATKDFDSNELNRLISLSQWLSKVLPQMKNFDEFRKNYCLDIKNLDFPYSKEAFSIGGFIPIINKQGKVLLCNHQFISMYLMYLLSTKWKKYKEHKTRVLKRGFTEQDALLVSRNIIPYNYKNPDNCYVLNLGSFKFLPRDIVFTINGDNIDIGRFKTEFCDILQGHEYKKWIKWFVLKLWNNFKNIFQKGKPPDPVRMGDPMNESKDTTPFDDEELEPV